jgi:hypothetical protein
MSITNCAVESYLAVIKKNWYLDNNYCNEFE